MDRGEHIASGPSPRGTARQNQREKAPRPPQLSTTPLGRRLTEIITQAESPRQAEVVSKSASETKETHSRIGPGLKSLLQGSKAHGNSDPLRAPIPMAGPKPINGPLVVGSLVAADLFLVVQAALLISGKQAAMSLAEWAFVFLSLALGAWLGSLAVLVGSRSEAEPGAER